MASREQNLAMNGTASDESKVSLVLEPVTTASIQEEVYARLRDGIQSGALHALINQNITLRQLAKTMNVSTTPVREALRRLEAQGLVTIRNRSGIIINRLSANEFAEVSEMRIHLEPLVLRRAIVNLADSEIGRLTGVLNELDHTTDVRAWRKLNHSFHIGIYRHARSPRTLAVVELLWDYVEPYIRLYTQTSDLSQAQREHRAILAAVAQGNHREAVEALRAHIRRSERELLRSPEAFGLLATHEVGHGDLESKAL